ncbi:MAG: hypothetical protein ACREB2_02630 [Pseudolabrys sp.]
MRCFLTLAANAVLSVLAAFGVADAATGYDLPALFYEGIGLIGGGLAGAAACVAAGAAPPEPDDPGLAGLPKAIGLVGTLAVCAAALMGHLSPVELKSAGVGLWIFGLAIQAGALVLAIAGRRIERASRHPRHADQQKTRGA